MGGETQENLSQAWLTPEALVEFIDELRQAGYHIGLDEYISAQDLLLLLAAQGERLDDPQRMARFLGPLLCSTPAEQQTFLPRFLHWAELRQAMLLGQAPARYQTLADELEEVKKRTLRWEWSLFAGIVLLLVAIAWYLFDQFQLAEGIPFPEQLPEIPQEMANDVVTLLWLTLAAVGLLGAVLIARWAWWQYRAHQFLERRQASRPVEIHQVSIQAYSRALFPDLPFLSLARLLRKRGRIISSELDILKTTEKTVEMGGWLVPAYDQQLVTPEYLVLFDRLSGNDQLAHYIEELIKRLGENGIFITAYSFDGDPRLCFPLHGKSRPQLLSELAARYESMRLIIFCETERLISPVSGKLAPWTYLFNNWFHRAVLIPEMPEHWGLRERELSRQFAVLPCTLEGLADFVRIVHGLEKPAEVVSLEASALPQVLRNRPQRWIARDAPPKEQIEAVLDELRAYLGESGYTWLCACAIYPELRWQILVYIGQALRDQDGLPLLQPGRLVNLARLPWFRYGKLPDWLRLRLIADLPADQEGKVRAALEALLVTAVQGSGEAQDLEIARQRPEWTGWLARPLLRMLNRRSPPESPLQDHVFLDFMLQRLNLAVRVPEALRRQLIAQAGGQAGWKLLTQWIGVNLLGAGVWSLVHLVFLIPYNIFNVPINVFLHKNLELLSYSKGIELLPIVATGLLLYLAQWWLLRRFWGLNGWLWVAGSMGIFFLFLLIAISRNEFFYLYGLAYLFILSLFHTVLLRIQRIQHARLWLYGGLLAGFVNTLLTILLPSASSTVSGFLAITIVSSLVYSLASGWVLLFLLRPRPAAATWLLRITWALTVPIGFSLGLIFLIFILVVFFPNPPSEISYELIYLMVGFLWMLPLAAVQWLVLHTYHFSQARLWFWLSYLAYAAGFILAALISKRMFSVKDPLSDMPVLLGMSLGILSGLAQSLVWRRSGLQPIHMVVWFLCSTLGWSIAFASIPMIAGITVIYDSFQVIVLDIISALFLLLGLLYGLITAWPLEPFLDEALRHQAGMPNRQAKV